MPIERLANGAWPHPARLPLGGGWSGQCTSPGHEGETPGEKELELCNLGYATGCVRLPQRRVWDAVRFAMVAPVETLLPEITPVETTPVRTTPVRAGDRQQRDHDGGARSSVQVRYVCERDHRPVEHGRLEFDVIESKWPHPHSDARVQKMAECFLQSYLDRKRFQAADKPGD